MASKGVRSSAQETVKSELSVLTMSDHDIMNYIYATHVHGDEKFDVDSLFALVENTLKRATLIVDNIALGTKVHFESLEDKTSKASFNTPLCTLKKVSCEMQCKALGEEIAHKTTMSILSKLSSYSWDAKAVLTLAAFALEYGDFWLLAQLHPSDQLAKSMGILKQVPVILRRPGLQKHRKALVELNNLIKTTLEVIECIFELEKLSIYDKRDVPALVIAMNRIPVDVYWAILTVVACSTKMCGLTNEDDQVQDLSPFALKLNIVLSILKKQIQLCKQQIGSGLPPVLQCTGAVASVTCVQFWPRVRIATTPLHWSTGAKPFPILTMLVDSSLDISIDEISILKPIYDAIRKEDQYKIVWIPIVDQWNDDTRKNFEMLKSKMPWYVVQYFSHIAGIRFIKEEWHFNNKPIIVVMNQKGQVECPNAIHMIRVWGMRAFPFSSSVEESLSNGRDWMGSIVTGINPNIHNWIKEEKYIFFYGGKDKEWIQQFTKRANALANDPVIKDARVSIELLCVGKCSKGEDDHSILGHFWNRMDSFFFSKTQKKNEPDPVTQEIQKLLSYKNESGWAVLSKGSRVVVSGHGTSFLKVLEEFDKWKESVRQMGFEICFKEYHEKLIIHTARRCCRVDIPFTPEKNPQQMTCPEAGCSRVMETYISHKCCHIDGAVNGQH
uniref:Sieve element occlusion N-terminal domain-containing protein n=1 Tax=Fagus sylvatica TaxID=28930 RepID=A0A2N9EJ56_FAGSY